MKYYLLFFLFNFINTLCYDDDYITGLSKEDCFGRELYEFESNETYFFEKADSCCFVKREFTIHEKDLDTIDRDLLAGISHCCYSFPKSQIEKIIEYIELYVEMYSLYKEYDISIDCISQVQTINLMIFIILLFLIIY